MYFIHEQHHREERRGEVREAESLLSTRTHRELSRNYYTQTHTHTHLALLLASACLQIVSSEVNWLLEANKQSMNNASKHKCYCRQTHCRCLQR